MFVLDRLSDEQWLAVEPRRPKNQPEARGVDDRQVISGIFHVLKIGCRWPDSPAEYGPLHHYLQPLLSLVPKTVLAEAARGHGGHRRRDKIYCCRLHLHQISAIRLRRKRGGSKDQATSPLRGGQTTIIHLLTEIVGHPFALTLTPGNVADITAAPALLDRAAGAARSWRTEDKTPTLCAERSARPAPCLSSRAGSRAKGRSSTTGTATTTATWSRKPSVGSKTSDAWPPATTSWPHAVVLAALLAFWL